MRRWALGCALLATLAVTARVGRRLLHQPQRAVSHDERTAAEDVHPAAGRGVPIASLRSSTQQLHLLGPPPALLLLAPHKTGSTFFAGFLNELSKLLGLCWYTDNAAFTWKPIDHTKCSTPLCGHPPNEKEKQFSASDLGWGDCSAFVRHHLEAAATCADGLNASCQRQVSAESGFLWGPLRLPGPMRHALQLLPRRPWKWHVILHQRHPLDALISGYHSFGWRHPAAPSASMQQRREHLAKQSAVRNQTIDEYVLANAAEMHRKYLPYFELLRDPPPGVIIIRSRYEDMVTFFEHWLQRLLSALQPLYSAHRLNATHHTLMHHARAFKPDGKHKRSVLPGRFTEELQPATIAKILKQHRTWCAELGYV